MIDRDLSTALPCTKASSLFKDAARAAGAHMVVGLEVTKHHNITVAVFEGDPSNDGVVLHISGTHGPEGYVGTHVPASTMILCSVCSFGLLLVPVH